MSEKYILTIKCYNKELIDFSHTFKTEKISLNDNNFFETIYFKKKTDTDSQKEGILKGKASIDTNSRTIDLLVCSTTGSENISIEVSKRDNKKHIGTYSGLWIEIPILEDEKVEEEIRKAKIAANEIRKYKVAIVEVALEK